MAHLYTWDKLARLSATLNPLSRGVNYPYVPKFEQELILPYVGTKSVLVKLKAWGRTVNAIHNVTLLFNDVEILQGEQENISLYKYFKLEYQGKIYYIKKFDKLRNPLTHRCSCADSFYTFAYYNAKNGNCLYGPLPRPYQRKTKTRPPRNPKHVPGMCKHVYHAWEYLRLQGLTIN